MVSFKTFLVEVKSPNKQFEEMKKLAGQIGKYSHRWNDNPSQRMLSWVDTYNDNKEKMKENGTWEEYCKFTGFHKSHNAYDCLA